MILDERICNLKIGNEEIKRIGNNCPDKYYKFVGIRTWEHQTNHVSSKVASATFALNQVKNFLPQYIRKIIYNCLVRTHLEYGILILGIKKSKNINKIITLQKKAVRNVARRGYNSHAVPIFGMLGLLKFEDILNTNACCLMYNYTNTKLLLFKICLNLSHELTEISIIRCKGSSSQGYLISRLYFFQKYGTHFH